MSQTSAIQASGAGSGKAHLPLPGKTQQVAVTSRSAAVKFHVFVDEGSVELFCDDGFGVISSQVYFGDSQRNVEWFSDQPGATLNSLEIFPLDQ